MDKFDRFIIRTLQRIWQPLARISLFIVFFWFGFLKIIGLSPAELLVDKLRAEVIPFIPFEEFVLIFGFYEMTIGLSFLIPHWERLAIALLIPHMISTFMPLIFLPDLTWTAFLIPTIEGQYIIKNLIIVSLALVIGANLKPFGKNKKLH